MTSFLSRTCLSDFLNSVYCGVPRNVFSLFTTGGGALSMQWLFTVPGASNSIISAGIPYSGAALKELLAGDVLQACSAETAEVMCRATFKKTVSQFLSETRDLNSLSEVNIFSVTCTAALVSAKPKKGTHRCHVAAANGGQVLIWSVYMNKGERDREGEDYLCSRLILEAISTMSCVSSVSRDYLLSSRPVEDGQELATEHIYTTTKPKKDIFGDLLRAKSGMVVFVKNSVVRVQTREDSGADPRSEDEGDSWPENLLFFEDITLPPGCIVYPGSFNPLHEGHVSLAAAAIRALEEKVNTREPGTTGEGDNQRLHTPVLFEISILNADKPPLATADVLRRVQQFFDNPLLRNAGLSNVAVCVTSRPLFVSKSALFENCAFLIGSDTLTRLLNVKYYDNSREDMIAALATMVSGSRGCSFIVGGRVDAHGGFVSCEEVLESARLPSQIQCKFSGISEEHFRCDISSTDIRNRLAMTEK